MVRILRHQPGIAAASLLALAFGLLASRAVIAEPGAAPDRPTAVGQPKATPAFDPERLRQSLAWALAQGVVTTPQDDAPSVVEAELPSSKQPADPAAPTRSLAASEPVPMAAAGFAPEPVATVTTSDCALTEPWFATDTGEAAADLSLAIAAHDAVLAASGSDTAARRSVLLAKAKTYFTAGLAQESLGVLKALSANDPDVASLRAAARILSGRRPDSDALAANEAPCATASVTPWQTAASALSRDPGQASPVVIPDETIARLAAYPPAHRRALGLILAEAALDAADIRRAGTLLEIVEETAPETTERGRLHYLKGRLARLRGDFAAAGRSWQDALDLPGDSSLEAAAALAALPSESIADPEGSLPMRLETLAEQWRGHGAAVDLASLAIERYLAGGRIDQALDLMARLQGERRDERERTALAERATALIAAGFEEDGAPRALERLWRFNALIADNAQGRALRLHAGRTLLAAGLPQAALDVLPGLRSPRQAEDGLTGRLRAEAELAAGRPAATLAALASSQGGEGDASGEREMLAARALAALGREAEAAGLLHDRVDRAARVQVADLLWQGGLWRDARTAYRRLHETGDALPPDIAATVARRLERLDRVAGDEATDDAGPTADDDRGAARLVAAARSLERRLMAAPL